MLSDSSHGFSKVEQVYHFADVIIDDLYWQAISPVWWTKTPPRFWVLRRLLQYSKSDSQNTKPWRRGLFNGPVADSS